MLPVRQHYLYQIWQIIVLLEKRKQNYFQWVLKWAILNMFLEKKTGFMTFGNGKPAQAGDRIPNDAVIVLQVGDGTRNATIL